MLNLIYTKMNSRIIFLILILSFQTTNNQEKRFFFRCGADDKNQTVFPATKYITIDKNKRYLNDGDFKDFHIYLDLINIKNDVKKYKLEEYEDLIVNSLEKAVKTLESLLKVRKLNHYYYFNDNEIEENIQIKYWNKTIVGTDAKKSMNELGIDLIIFARFDEEMNNYTLASAGSRYMDVDTYQPIVGIVNINTNINFSKINSQEYFQSIIIHEFTHILGFNSYYFYNYIHNIFYRKDEIGNYKYFINSTKVLEVAKKYYNCSDIDGVELENYGGTGTAGSHWEARILLGEYMNGVIYPEEQVISEFTLALLEDTGYYKANYFTGGLMRYGKGKGCDFVKRQCVNSEHEINPYFENEFYDSIYNPNMDSSCSSGRQSRTYFAFFIYDYLPSYYQYFEDKNIGGYGPADFCPVAMEFQQDNMDAYYTGHCSLKGNGKYGTGVYYPYETETKIKSSYTQISSIFFNYYRNEDLFPITGETYSDHSFCYQSSLIKNNLVDIFNSNVVRAVCYESFCSSNSLTIKINDDFIVCPKAGGKILVEGYIGYFLCPDYNLICSGTKLCNDMFDCVDMKSEIKNESYIYDYKIKTSQNIENSYIDIPDEINNYELGEDGICSINCKQCKEKNKCIKCRIDYSFFGSKESEEIKCISNSKLNAGYYQDNNIYYKCMENCDICLDDLSCEKCSKGFYYFNEKCKRHNIENCEIYGKDSDGKEIDICIKCKDNYFLFYNNLYCLPCNDSLYGQVGCEGNCDASNYLQTRNVICNKNDCRDGYYNLNGICLSCSKGSKGCKKCTITLNEINKEVYNCLECLNNEYKYLSSYGCAKCYLDEEHCKKCHFISINSYSKECDECEEGFYLDKNKQCKKCHYPIEISNGYCRVCSDNKNDYQSGNCWCYEYYTKKSHSTCVKCPDKCPYCEFNHYMNNVECLICEPGYTLNSMKTCTYCGEGCKYCSLSDNSTPICNHCYSNILLSNGKCLVYPENCISYNNGKCIECSKNYTLLSDGKCGKCPPNCSKCKTNENDEIICLQCYEHYALKLQKECIYCKNINYEGMENCEKCGYNENTKKFECYECGKKEMEESYDLYDAYVYINNTFQCFNNMDRKQPDFYGCAEAYKNGEKYECNKCSNYKISKYSGETFIKVINQKKCINTTDFGLYACFEAENIGTEQNPIYSCTKCASNHFLLKNKNNQVTCGYRSGKLSYCQEGKAIEKYKEECTQCSPNSHFNNSKICNCDTGYFGQNDWYCYKCDDIIYGNPGCLAEKGCTYNRENSQLNCNQCKDEYFNYTEGQCYSCSSEIENCEKCHYNTTINKLICDKCQNNYNLIEQKCILKQYIECEDYPEISEGCLICEEKREEYLAKNKCHMCKPGYFKTKNEQCINCRSEEYGGQDCLKCKYDIDQNGKETDNIVCEYCPELFHAKNSDGKCYNCEKYLSNNCEVCAFIKNDNLAEKLVCILCKPGFYLNSKGKCINYLNYLQQISNCFEYFYQINDISFCSFNNNSAKYCKYNPLKINGLELEIVDSNYKEYNSYYDYKKEIKISNFIMPIINSTVEAKCIKCSYGDYYPNSEGKCDKISIEDCSLISIAKYFPKRYFLCLNYCQNLPNYIYERIPYINSTNNYNIEIFDANIFFSDVFYDGIIHNQIYEDIFENIDDILKPIFIKKKLCIPKPETGDFQNCQRIIYDDKTKVYKCDMCIKGKSCKLDVDKDYYLDNDNCLLENIGTSSNPIYSCVECYNNSFLLVKNEDNIRYCKLKDEQEIKYCTEANANTSFINTLYNCTKCSLNFLPFYSEFFGRSICQNIFEEIVTENKLSLEIFEEAENVNATEEGICEKKNFFTPDGKKCYKCNDEKVGMPGCKGNCNFSSKRNEIIKCEDECEKGYIKVKEGICEPCENVNQGCYECHYENEYPDNYTKLKRKRRFVCDYCETGFVKIDGKCLSCFDLIDDCEECNVDLINNDKIKCSKCNENSILLENGRCNRCDDSNRFQNNNKCHYCDDVYNNGIKGCIKCEKKEKDELICQLCDSGYILLENNNTCLNIFENKELQKFDLCEKLTKDNNNQLYCIRCKRGYSLLKDNDNDKGKCIKVSILFDYDLSQSKNYLNDNYSNYLKLDEYYYYKYYQNYPCQESINLGTFEKPIFSCLKCYNIFEFNKKYLEAFEFTKITNKRNNVSYCANQNELLRNCTNAINKTKEGIEKYDCLKCTDDNILIYDSYKDINYCQYDKKVKKCMVKYCKTCKYGNNYFCKECATSNYEVNRLTGQCVEISDQVPYIIWKDIFRLEINGEHQRNGLSLSGIYFMLRGITNYKINTKHAFLIYLTFKVNSSLRNLENNKEIILPSICEIKNSVKESKDDINIVEYECFSNNTNNINLDNYHLDEIKEGENEGLLKKSNINEISKKIRMENMIRDIPKFKLEDAMKYLIFEIDNIQNQTAQDFIFNFKLLGQLNKEINKGNITVELALNEIEDKVNCNFIFEDNKKGKLNCFMDINRYKNINVFTFKTTELNMENYNIFLSKLDKISLINYFEDETSKNITDEINEGQNINIDINISVIGGNNSDENNKDEIFNSIKIDENKNDENKNDENKNDENKNDENKNDENKNDENKNDENKNDENNDVDKNINKTNNNENINIDKNKKKFIAIIVGCLSSGLVVMIGLILLIFYLVKRKNKQVQIKNTQKIIEYKNKTNFKEEIDCKSNEPI